MLKRTVVSMASSEETSTENRMYLLLAFVHLPHTIASFSLSNHQPSTK